jgi:Xaa-Pro aminopeptidase
MSAAVHRLRELRKRLAARGESALLAMSPIAIGYLSGARDAAWALVTATQAVLMPSALGYEAARRGVKPPWMVLSPGAGRLKPLLARLGIRRVGFEADAVTHAGVARLGLQLKDAAVLVPLSGLVEDCREVKDDKELAVIRRAGAIAAAAGAQMPWILREGMTEAEGAAALDIRMRELGADGPAFETILLFGWRSALPHGVPGPRRLAAGDLILLDFGARVDGYASDCTRTWCWRRATARQRRTYRAVARAYRAGRSAVRAGVPAGKVDAAARGTLGALRSRFIHGVGHGVGLEIHERPRLARGEKTRLRPGMVVTVEPGVYFGRWGGIRLEDTVIVTPRGASSVTGAPAADLPVIGPGLP